MYYLSIYIYIYTVYIHHYVYRYIDYSVYIVIIYIYIHTYGHIYIYIYIRVATIDSATIGSATSNLFRAAAPDQQRAQSWENPLWSGPPPARANN